MEEQLKKAGAELWDKMAALASGADFSKSCRSPQNERFISLVMRLAAMSLPNPFKGKTNRAMYNDLLYFHKLWVANREQGDCPFKKRCGSIAKTLCLSSQVNPFKWDVDEDLTAVKPSGSKPEDERAPEEAELYGDVVVWPARSGVSGMASIHIDSDPPAHVFGVIPGDDAEPAREQAEPEKHGLLGFFKKMKRGE